MRGANAMPMKVCISAPIWLTKHTRRIIIRTISTEIWGRRISLRRLQEPTPWTPVLFCALRCAPHGAPPFGTRKNALRRWRRSVFFLMSALVRARRGGRRLSGGARRACAPVRHSPKRLAPMAPFGLFSYVRARASCSLVPVVGLEPTRILLHRILSPARLPVSPHRRSYQYSTAGAS